MWFAAYPLRGRLLLQQPAAAFPRTPVAWPHDAAQAARQPSFLCNGHGSLAALARSEERLNLARLAGSVPESDRDRRPQRFGSVTSSQTKGAAAVLRDATHWDDVVTKLGYEHLRRHDLRHTGLTWFADAGVQVHVLRRIAGHGSLTTTQRYLHPDVHKITAAGAGLSAHLSVLRAPRSLPSPIVVTR